MYDLLCIISFYLYKKSILIVIQKRARDLSQEPRASLYVIYPVLFPNYIFLFSL